MKVTADFMTIQGRMAKHIDTIDRMLDVFGFVSDKESANTPSEYVGVLEIHNHNSVHYNGVIICDLITEGGTFPIEVCGLELKDGPDIWDYDVIIPHNQLVGLLKYTKLVREIVFNAKTNTEWENPFLFNIKFKLFVNDEGVVDFIEGHIMEEQFLEEYKFLVGNKETDAHFWKNMIDYYVNTTANETWSTAESRTLSAVECSVIPMVLSKDKESVVMNTSDIAKLVVDGISGFTFSVQTTESKEDNWYMFRLELPHIYDGSQAFSKYMEMPERKYIKIPYAELRTAEIFKRFGYELDGMLWEEIPEFTYVDHPQRCANTISLQHGPYLQATQNDITKRYFVEDSNKTFHKHVYDILGISNLISAWETVSKSIDNFPHLICRKDAYTKMK